MEIIMTARDEIRELKKFLKNRLIIQEGESRKAISMKEREIRENTKEEQDIEDYWVAKLLERKTKRRHSIC